MQFNFRQLLTQTPGYHPAVGAKGNLTTLLTLAPANPTLFTEVLEAATTASKVGRPLSTNEEALKLLKELSHSAAESSTSTFLTLSLLLWSPACLASYM